MRAIISRLLAPTLIAATMSAPIAYAAPSGKTECIAPAQPGGGWDFTCRSVARTLQEENLIPAGMQTVNLPGASGGVAFSHVLSKRRGDEDVIIAASTATTTQLAQRRYGKGDSDQVRWVASLGADYGVIAVAKDSPWHSLSELMAALKDDPRAASFAGGDVAGGLDHIKVLMAAQKAGADKLREIKYLAFDSGSVAITQLLGHHIDVFTGDLSEALGFVQSGDLRLLAVLSEQRLPGELADIPTAREQGIDVVAPNWRGFYIPGGTSNESYAYWVKTLDSLYASDAWQKVMADSGLLPFHKSGDEMTEFVNQQIHDIRTVSDGLGLSR
ncbi:Bug family tripartite tricarboxylate transporter substrate binding protein [Phytohalomonas tamaricis]|uniref:Bug family tripartite tricarboxylate transporter substrate binding protein n=1 Tax=Phytohalomonas tamaricis TaxID=2081032 RepID=UPI000D0BBC61|nr:tripartite tricarboxylate transporter substrate-binding protein [Phytohalomonas tamaricis]